MYHYFSNVKSKAINILKHASHNINKNKPNLNTNPIKRYIILSPNPTTTLTEKNKTLIT